MGTAIPGHAFTDQLAVVRMRPSPKTPVGDVDIFVLGVSGLDAIAVLDQRDGQTKGLGLPFDRLAAEQQEALGRIELTGAERDPLRHLAPSAGGGPLGRLSLAFEKKRQEKVQNAYSVTGASRVSLLVWIPGGGLWSGDRDSIEPERTRRSAAPAVCEREQLDFRPFCCSAWCSLRRVPEIV